MLAYNITAVYADLLRIGLVRNKRQFSSDFLARGKTYLRDLERADRDRAAVRIPDKTITVLRARLRAVERLASRSVQAEIARVLANIDRDTRVADVLGYR